MLSTWLVQLIQSPVGQSVLGFGASYAAGNILDGLREKMKDDSIEYQMLRCMDNALEKLCSIHKNPEWEYDSTAMCSTFVKGICEWGEVYTHDGLKKTLSDALGHDVTDEDLTLWISFFHQQIAKSENNELRNYLCTMKLFDISGTAPSNPYRPPTVLTAKVSIWERELFGRETILGVLHNAICSGNQHIQLVGMGGIGKTEILHKLYAYYADASNRVETVDHLAYLSYRGSMDQSVRQLDFQPRNTQDNDTYWDFLRSCGENGKLLLLIDDITPSEEDGKSQDFSTDESFQSLFSVRATIVFASRKSDSRFEPFPVGFLPLEDCIKVFKKNYELPLAEEQLGLLSNIIEKRSGKNTLVVQRLGAMAANHGWDITKLSARLEEKSFQIKTGMDEITLQQEINKLYRIDELVHSELSIVEAFSILPALPLDIDACEAWLSSDACIDKDDCRLILNSLARRTWLEKRVDAVGVILFSMHAVVAAAVENQREIIVEKHNGLVDGCSESIGIKETDTLEKARPYAPFALEVARKFLSSISAEMAAFYQRLGYYYYNEGNYILALELCQDALRFIEKVSLEKSSDYATICSCISLIYTNLGDGSNALKYGYKALDMRKDIFGSDSDQLANSYNNLALVHRNRGEYAQALELHLKALSLLENNPHKSDSPILATIYNNIASDYDAIGEYNKALTLHQRALKIREKVLGNMHPETASTYNNIAATYCNKKDFEKAIEWYLKALKIAESVLGTKHPHTASTYNNIATAYSNIGRNSEALDYLNKTLSVAETVFGFNHPNTATTYNNIGLAHYRNNNYEAALEWFNKALSVRENILEVGHPDFATSYNNIAGIHEKLGNYSKAFEMYKEAFSILECNFGKNHPSTIAIFSNMTGAQETLQRSTPPTT